MFSKRFVDLTGDTYGERTVKSFSHQRKDSGNYYWNVICSCGREGKVSGTRLKKGTKCISCSGRDNGRKGLYTMASKQPCYFIRCNEYVKVGSSANPERRMRDMISANPYDLQLLFVDNENNEEYWHNKLKNYHFKGEWYYYSGVCEIVDV